MYKLYNRNGLSYVSSVSSVLSQNCLLGTGERQTENTGTSICCNWVRATLSSCLSPICPIARVKKNHSIYVTLMSQRLKHDWTILQDFTKQSTILQVCLRTKKMRFIWVCFFLDSRPYSLLWVLFGLKDHLLNLKSYPMVSEESLSNGFAVLHLLANGRRHIAMEWPPNTRMWSDSVWRIWWPQIKRIQELNTFYIDFIFSYFFEHPNVTSMKSLSIPAWLPSGPGKWGLGRAARPSWTSIIEWPRNEPCKE